MRFDPGYAAIMIAAPLSALLASRFVSSRPLPLNGRQKLGLAIGAFCGAMISAKIPYVIMSGPDQGISVWFQDGKTILFGMLGGYLGVELAKHLMGIRTKTGDNFAVPAAVAIAIGRIGCFYGGCCFGSPTDLPWACRFRDGIPRHPTQLYEFLFHAAAAVVLYGLAKRRMFPGNLIKLYFLAYFAFRFVTEFIRPEPRVALGLTFYQWTALLAAPLFALLLWKDWRTEKA